MAGGRPNDSAPGGAAAAEIGGQGGAVLVIGGASSARSSTTGAIASAGQLEWLFADGQESLCIGDGATIAAVGPGAPTSDPSILSGTYFVAEGANIGCAGYTAQEHLFSPYYVRLKVTVDGNLSIAHCPTATPTQSQLVFMAMPASTALVQLGDGWMRMGSQGQSVNAEQTLCRANLVFHYLKLVGDSLTYDVDELSSVYPMQKVAEGNPCAPYPELAAMPCLCTSQHYVLVRVSDSTEGMP